MFYDCFQLHFPYYEWWILAGDTYVQQTLVAPLFTYKSVFDGLTRQEQTVFKKLIERKSRSQITKELNIVERSLENYLSKIYQKTGCKNHEELIKKFGEWNEEKNTTGSKETETEMEIRLEIPRWKINFLQKHCHINW